MKSGATRSLGKCSASVLHASCWGLVLGPEDAAAEAYPITMTYKCSYKSIRDNSAHCLEAVTKGS